MRFEVERCFCVPVVPSSLCFSVSVEWIQYYYIPLPDDWSRNWFDQVYEDRSNSYDVAYLG